jgi:molybdate transport system substrate-binding protein
VICPGAAAFIIALLLRDGPAAGQPAADTTVLTVSAAISLTDALEAVARAYRQAGGGTVQFNFAASNVLVRQIVSGAPVDVYISADETQMDVAAKSGAVDGHTRIDLLGNRLALIARPDFTGLRDARDLLQPAIRRIAIGDPDAVPAGVYARQFLQAAGLWDGLRAKLIPVANVRAAVAAVENGSVDLAIGYESDAAVAKHARTVLVISGAAAPRIVYPAAIVSRSPHREAAGRFLSFLRGAEAAAIFKTFMFVPLAR